MQFDNSMCDSYPLELWFPPAFDESPTGTDNEYFEVAKLVCSVCVHQSACAVLGEDERYGMWGGATPAERRKGSTKPPKRLMNEEGLALLPNRFDSDGKPTRVDINTLRASIQAVTRKRQPAS